MIFLVDASFVFCAIVICIMVFVYGIVSLWPVIKIFLWIILGYYIISDAVTGITEKKGDKRVLHFFVHSIGFFIMLALQQYWISGLNRMLSGSGNKGILDFILEFCFGGMVVLGVDYVTMFLMNLITGDD